MPASGFDEGQRAAVERAIFGPLGAALLDLICSLNLGEPTRTDESVVRLAVDLGWLHPPESATLHLTRLGWKVADPIREYGLWQRRGRRLPAAGECGSLSEPSLRGRRVLDLGCGSGCNLLSLGKIGASAVGLDLDPLYLQFASLIARLEGARCPTVCHGQAERLPFHDRSFDVVLATGTLAYMDVNVVVGEVRRVLKDGGRLICLQGSFGLYAIDSLRQRNWRRTAAALPVLLDSISYQWLGRRLRTNRTEFTTKLPVHLPHRSLCRTLRKSGLRPIERETCRVGYEVCVVAERLA